MDTQNQKLQNQSIPLSTGHGVINRKMGLMKHLKQNWQLYFFMLVPIVYYIIFRYVPMAGNIIAFRRYRAGSSIFGDEWSGFKYFKQFINDQSFWRAFRNTLSLNVVYLLFRFPMTLIFALLLNEIKNLQWKKFVQTVSYLPHFISVVIVTGMIRELVSASGPLNRLIAYFGGETTYFIALPQWFMTIFVVSGIWQSLGWGTILYLAAMSNISPNLYEAAEIDGANHFQRVWHITIPSILPTITTLLILDVGGLVGSSMAFEKVYLLYNPMIYETADIISTYVFRMGLDSGNYSYATAVGLFEGLINLVLLTIANIASKRVTNSGLW
ncbi:MAG TPA: ABC transporter permease subunit [Treponemataceae bacterium]|jgi:putative aldouronate transport system permease protein|nr:ABC transporter permease subunit [Treponemataceae bacterium]